MSRLTDLTNEIKKKVDVVKKADTQRNVIDRIAESTASKITSPQDYIGRKIDDFQDVQKSKKTEVKDIFGEVIETVEGFIGSTDQQKTSNSEILKYSKEAAKTTLLSSKQMVIETIKTKLFSGDGVCGTTSIMSNDTIEISPKEFDLLNMLTVDPDTNTGKIMYESDVDKGHIKMNKEFFNLFDSNSGYSFINNHGQELFNIIWNESTQKYTISGLQGVSGITTVQSFLTDYYASIEYPDIENILKQSMMRAINGNGDSPKTFTVGMNKLDRMLQKLFSLCGKLQNDYPLNQNDINQVDDDSDFEWYFDFDDVEGIDLDDEDAKYRGVLKFKSCDNFEVPVNTTHIEDFVYLFKKKINPDDIIDRTINNLSSELYEKSEQSITLEDFKKNLIKFYIKELPKSLISAILSPKMLFPIVIIYKLSKNINVSIDINDIIKKLPKLFFQLIKNVFWKFLQNFWKLLKPAILKFIKKLASEILKNKLKRIRNIIIGLIALLTKLLTNKMESCEAIFGAILATINGALNQKITVPLPGILLIMAEQQSGFSTDRASINIIEGVSAAGIPTEPIFGRENTLPIIFKGIVDGIMKEIDENAYFKGAPKPIVLPSTPAGTIITPESFTIIGKLV